MAQAVIENFEFHRGRTYTRDFIVTDFNDPIDEILFTACENTANKHYCLRKSLNKGIALVDEGVDEEGFSYKVYNLLIEATDTDHMKAGTDYGYDIVLYSGTQKHQLIEGTLSLAATRTKTCNECVGE
jgi:hypothetical protein